MMRYPGNVLRLGFACVWHRQPELTWSHIPWNLRAALREICSIQDIELTIPEVTQRALRLSSLRWDNGKVVSNWAHARATKRLSELRAYYADMKINVDAVVQIGDIGMTSSPSFVFQDMSYDLLIEIAETTGVRFQLPRVTDRKLRWLVERQHSIYEKSAGVFAMSRWFGESLTRLSGVPPEKVHVVYAGSTATGPVSAEALKRRLNGSRDRLLFIGRDFVRKGGKETLEALSILRRDFNPGIRLTIAGPQQWPLAGNIPEGVDFIGSVPQERLSNLYEEHDIFILPSRFEPFGIVLVEALSHGLPCVARDAFAMPEVVLPGVNGALVKTTAAEELASAIANVIVDDRVFDETARRSAKATEFFTWQRAAKQIHASILMELENWAI